MLVHIDGSAVADATSGSATAGRSHTCIENLLLAHAEGNHVVSLLPTDAATLRPMRWADRARRALEHIDYTYSEIAGLREDINWTLELGVGPTFEAATSEVTKDKTVLRAPIHRFEKVHTTACSALLGENRTDAELFREFGLMQLALRQWGQVQVILDPRGTGGSTFAQEYGLVADRGVIVLAIADTDQRHPAGGVGETYRKLKVEAAKRPAYQRAKALHTRTLEGAVPPAVYREAFNFPRPRNGDSRGEIVARLEQLLGSAPTDVKRYADFKKGITWHQVQNLKSEDEKRYWLPIATTAERDRCVRSTGPCAKREECQCYVVNALGAEALVAVLVWSKSHGVKKDLAELFCLAQDAELSALAEEVLAWGLALSPLLA